MTVELSKNEFADIHSASDDYAKRFSGPGGKWLLEIQDRILLSIVHARRPGEVLDVGGGHGQIVRPLVAHGISVRVLVSAEEGIGQVRPLLNTGKCSVDIGDPLALPFNPRSFDLVTSFRILPHCDSWRELIRELCRVSSDSVVVDYPGFRSVNIFSSLLFGMKKKVEKNTRPFTLFWDSDVDAEFAMHGFYKERRIKQFFFPMVIYRMIGNGAIASVLEAIPKCIGLTALFGSPAIAWYRRKQ